MDTDLVVKIEQIKERIEAAAEKFANITSDSFDLSC